MSSLHALSSTYVIIRRPENMRIDLNIIREPVEPIVVGIRPGRQRDVATLLCWLSRMLSDCSLWAAQKIRAP